MTEIEKKALALVERLRGLFEKATPGDLNTAERHTLSEYVECPMCGGDGEVGATDYCNFDGVALGVQFYGIGKEFGAHEKLWSELIKSTPVMLDLIETQAREIERLSYDLGCIANEDWKDMTVGSARDFARAARGLKIVEVGHD